MPNTDTSLATLDELLSRTLSAGSRVTNCVIHMDRKITERSKECNLCNYDVANYLSRAIAINEWLNQWKDDATELLKKQL